MVAVTRETKSAPDGRDALLGAVVAAIKQKKELDGLDDDFVRGKVTAALAKEPKLRAKLEAAKGFREFSRSKEFKELKRTVREELRKVYGVFQEEKRRGGKSSTDVAEERLRAHQSSAERLPHYDEVYQRIFAITGEPRSILDLGCGANPYSYDALGCAPFYVAVDLPNDELQAVAKFFKERGIDGEVLGLDLAREYNRLDALTAARPFDVAFLFKLLDSLEAARRNVSGKLLDAVHATWLVVSFPTVSIGGGKRIRKERRAWFEKLLRRKGWHWEEFAIENEVFYVVKKRV